MKKDLVLFFYQGFLLIIGVATYIIIESAIEPAISAIQSAFQSDWSKFSAVWYILTVLSIFLILIIVIIEEIKKHQKK